ncbi:unnamed protein product [Symbiodinium pilosum]|uniref:Uncharacterized protein n=1 Tax=Symbiodinium pilosum TaxID=2952 RepID=A0A812LM63_SYMPI|nr:unnamed protein product [Symbiodinium pilosum]
MSSESTISSLHALAELRVWAESLLPVSCSAPSSCRLSRRTFRRADIRSALFIFIIGCFGSKFPGKPRFRHSSLVESGLCLRRFEQAEARSAQRAGEVKGELRAAEALNQTNATHLKGLEVQLMTAREALAEAEADRSTKTSWSKRLGHELADARAGEQEAWQMQAQQAHELREARRRLDQLVGGGTSMPGGQLAQCKRRLLDLEQACSRKEAEVAEERRARERCHTEAVRASEKLRAARAQGAQLKERLRTLEESELRYPSRFPPQKSPALQPKPQVSTRRPSRSFSVPAEGRLRDGRRADSQPMPSNWAQETLQTPEQPEHQPSTSSADDVQVMKNFVKSEEARLRALSTAQGSAESTASPPPHKEVPRGLDSGYRLSWEEAPRAAIPLKASEPPAQLPEEDLSLAALLSMQPPTADKQAVGGDYERVSAAKIPTARREQAVRVAEILEEACSDSTYKDYGIKELAQGGGGKVLSGPGIDTNEAGVLQGGGKWPKRIGGLCRSLVEEEDLSTRWPEGSLGRYCEKDCLENIGGTPLSKTRPKKRPPAEAAPKTTSKPHEAAKPTGLEELPPPPHQHKVVTAENISDVITQGKFHKFVLVLFFDASERSAHAVAIWEYAARLLKKAKLKDLRKAVLARYDSSSGDTWGYKFQGPLPRGLLYR